MSPPQSTDSIVVGIDGSDAAINAAKWAVAEAASRDIPLRLIHAIPERPHAPAGESSLDIGYAESALRTVTAALHAMAQQVKIDVDIVRGLPASALIDESRYAAMICVGSVGIGRIARKLLGSTADAIAHKAHCPAAIIRTSPEAAVSDKGWIGVVVDDSPGNGAVLDHGFREARLREASILALGSWRWGLGEIPFQQLNHRLARWVAQYPEVHVQPTAARRGAAEFITTTDELVRLTVVGSDAAGEVARMVGPVTHHPSRHTECSVLVVHA